jgi:hypothetical protein
VLKKRAGQGWRWTSGRTENMCPMSVTLDVFQLDTLSLNVARPLNSPFMSVIEETPHSEMGPYIILALMLLHSRTAIFKEAVVVKVHAPRPLQAEPYAVMKAALLAHAQRMRSLLLADSPLVYCQVEREHTKRPRCRGSRDV